MAKEANSNRRCYFQRPKPELLSRTIRQVLPPRHSRQEQEIRRCEQKGDGERSIFGGEELNDTGIILVSRFIDRKLDFCQLTWFDNYRPYRMQLPVIFSPEKIFPGS